MSKIQSCIFCLLFHRIPSRILCEIISRFKFEVFTGNFGHILEEQKLYIFLIFKRCWKRCSNSYQNTNKRRFLKKKNSEFFKSFFRVSKNKCLSFWCDRFSHIRLNKHQKFLKVLKKCSILRTRQDHRLHLIKYLWIFFSLWDFLNCMENFPNIWEFFGIFKIFFGIFKNVSTISKFLSSLRMEA